MNKNLIIALILIIIVLTAGLVFYLYGLRLPQTIEPIKPLNGPSIDLINANDNINSFVNPTAPETNLNMAANSNSNSINLNQPRQAQTFTVSISDFSFHPNKININIGDTIDWINDDPAPHTITGSGFNSSVLNTGDSYSFTFAQSGTYDYYCSLHPVMKGAITVQ